jgi:hypothetical protein
LGSYVLDKGEQVSRLRSVAWVFGETSLHQIPYQFRHHLNRSNAALVLGRELSHATGIKRRRA